MSTIMMRPALLLMLGPLTLAMAGTGDGPSYPQGFYRDDGRGWITSAPGPTIQEAGPGRTSPIVQTVNLKPTKPRSADASEIRTYAFYHDACARAVANGDCDGDGEQFRFSEAEFERGRQARDLLDAVNGRADTAVSGHLPPLQALNALLDRRDLRNILRRRLTLSDSVRDLADKLDAGIALPKAELRALNRTILENEFPDLAPQMFSTCTQAGHLDFRPLKLAGVKEAVESYFSAKAGGSALRRVIATRVIEDPLRFVVSIDAEYARPPTPGPMGIPGALEFRRERYYIQKMDGRVSAVERPIVP
jgi:hypothetical protein